MSPGVLVEDPASLGDKELMNLDVFEEEDAELELRLVSSTQSIVQSSLSHDMSSPFIANPQSPSGEKSDYIENREVDDRNTFNVFNSLRQDPNGGRHQGNELGKHSPVKHDSFVDNSLDDSHLNQTPIKLSYQNLSPWRQFRPPSNLNALQSSSTIFNNKPDLKYSAFNPTSSESETKTHSKSEELNNELLHYKVKLKLMRDFLRDLIDKKSIDTSEIRLIIAEVDIKPSQLLLEKQIEQFEVEKKELLGIIDELYAQLEEFEHCIQAQRDKITGLNSVFHRCQDSIEAFTIHLQEDGKSRPWRDILDHLLTKSLPERVEILIHIAKEAITLSINGEAKVPGKRSTPLTPPISNYELDSNASLAKEVEGLKRENRKLLEQNRVITSELDDKDQEVLDLQKQLEATTEANVKLRQNMEFETKGNAEKVIHLQKVINGLGNDLKEAADQRISNDHTERISPAQYECLVTEHQDLQNAYANLLEELNQLRESAANQLPMQENKAEQHSSNLETTYLSDQGAKVTELRTELDRAMKKLKLHDSDQAQMTYINTQLKKENEELQSKLKKMADFVTYTTTDEKERVVKKLSVIEFQFKDLLKFDLGVFQKLIQSFNKIAEDESLLNPIKRYERIKKTLVCDLDESNTRILRDNHKLVFEYFVRATDILINNYVRLLLQGDETQSNETWMKQIAKLKEQNGLLKNELELLQRKIQESATTEAESPTSQLRLNDIRQKWKAERERRIMEDKEAQKRYNELRNEISKTRSAT